jgi:hypothetical protein
MKKWLKVLGSLVGAVVLAAMVVGTVFAQGPVEDGGGVNDRYASAPEYVDEDGDGVCDVCGDALGEGYGLGSGYGFVDADGDGVNDRYASAPGYVDEDGDGVCDARAVAPGEGAGQGRGRGLQGG